MRWFAKFEDEISRLEPVLKICRRQDGKQTFVAALEFTEETKEGYLAVIPEAMAGSEAIAFVQAIMDAGYDYGLRPSRGQDERDLRAHLADMRTITFKKLGIEK